MSLAVQALLVERLGHLSLTIHRYVSYRASSDSQECRFFLHDVDKKDAQADASLIKKIRKGLGGTWEKTNQEYMDLCLHPPQSLLGVSWLKAGRAGWIPASPLETLQTEGRHAKKDEMDKTEVVEDALKFMPRGVAGQFGYLLLSAICMVLVLVSLGISYRAFFYAKDNLGANWVFGISALLAIFLYLTARAIILNVGKFGLNSLAAVIAGSTPVPAPQSVSVTSACLRGLLLTAGILGLLDLWSVSVTQRHLWQVQDLQAATFSAFPQTELDVDLQDFLNAPAQAPRQGLHIAVPQYLGGHIYWIYANGRIVGRHTVDALNSFRFHKTDSGTYVYSTEGELLLKVSVDYRLPIYYPKGKGLFQEDLPTLAYEDPELYELIEVPLAPGQYQIDILDIYTPLPSHTLNPLSVAYETALEIKTGQFSFHVTSLSHREAQAAVRMRDNDPAWPEKEMNRIQLQFRDDHMRQVLDNAEDMTGDFFMDMTEVGLGTREFDAEQVLHMRKWLRQKYESSLAEIENR